MWRMSCEKVSAFDEAVTAKDAEISNLKARIAELEASRLDPVAPPTHTPALELPRRFTHGLSVTVPHPSPHSSHEASRASLAHSTPRRGKAPPVSEFTGDDPDCSLEDWLPSLERAIMSTAWTDEEHIIQLAGHLKSRALQERDLLRLEDRASCAKAVESLRLRLGCGRTSETPLNVTESLCPTLLGIWSVHSELPMGGNPRPLKRYAAIWPAPGGTTPPANEGTSCVRCQELPGADSCGQERRETTS